MKLTRSPLAPDAFPDLPLIAGVTAATYSRGFYAKSGAERDDVFLCKFAPGTTCAGVFTLSYTASADVQWCRDALLAGEGKASALIVNAGNSNAFTGPKGVEKNDATLAALETSLDVDRHHCFIAATGVIGEPLPNPNYIGEAVSPLKDKLAAPNWLQVAQAFMTTDTFPKGAGARAEIDGKPISLAGIAKGSGMIAPNMATMLAFVFTDAAIAAPVLDGLLREITDRTFNSITVDGDTSTSDTLMVFATGAAGNAPIMTIHDPRLDDFKAKLESVCLDLATQLVKDGEGATKFITLEVTGAISDESAKRVALAIGNSPLVKTALAASDANWGRIVMAAGKAFEPLDQDELAIWFGDLQVAKYGARADGYSEEDASKICAEPYISIRIDLGMGSGSARVYTCDLTHMYIEINGAYRT